MYVRVSSQEQVQNFSLPSQRDACERYCRAHGLTIVRVFEDAGKSAKNANRPALQEMMEFVKANEVRCVVVYNVSRFSRDTGDHFMLRAMLRANGTELRSASEQLDDTPHGKFLESMVSALAQLDNDAKSVRTRTGMREAQRHGRWTHPAPHGYLNAPAGRDGPSLVPNPAVAPFITAAFERFATAQFSIVELAAALAREGMKSARGRPIDAKRMREILVKEEYVGRLRNEDWDVDVPGDWMPLVTEDLFERVQHVLGRNATPTSPQLRDRDEFPLRRFVRCARCSVPLTGSSSVGRNGTRYPYYSCRTGCRVRVPADALHEAFEARLASIQPTRATLRLFKLVVVDVLRERTADTVAERKRAEAEVDRLRTRRGRLLDLALQGAIPGSELSEHRQRIDAELTGKLDALEAMRSAEIRADELLEFAERTLFELPQLWNRLNLRQRQRFQSLVFPEGLDFDGFALGTAVTGGIFKVIGPGPQTEADLASLRGVGWNQLAAWLREVAELREIVESRAA